MFHTFCSICFSLSHEKKQSFFNFKFPRIRKFQIKLGWVSGLEIIRINTTAAIKSKSENSLLLLYFFSFSCDMHNILTPEANQGNLSVCQEVNDGKCLLQYQYSISDFCYLLVSNTIVCICLCLMPMTAFSGQMAIKTSAFCCFLPFVYCVFRKLFSSGHHKTIEYYQINYIQQAILWSSPQHPREKPFLSILI